MNGMVKSLVSESRQTAGMVKNVGGLEQVNDWNDKKNFGTWKRTNDWNSKKDLVSESWQMAVTVKVLVSESRQTAGTVKNFGGLEQTYYWND